MKILEIVMLFIILVITIFIGSPMQYNCVELSIGIVAIGIIFIIYMLCKKKKIIENKLDIAVLVLCISPIVPLIFNSYTSLNDTLQYLLKYLSCFSIYIMVKQIVKNNPKTIKKIVNILIISSIILTIIGIDYMSTQVFMKPLEKIGIPHMDSTGKVMSSSLGNTNTFAIILAVSIILILYEMYENRRAIYFPALTLNFATLLLTNSRAMWVIFAIFFIVYLIMNKNKKKSIYLLYTLLFAGIISIIYVISLKEVKFTKQHIWMIIALLSIVTYILFKLFNKMYEKIITKFSNKKNIIILATFFAIVLTLFIVGTKLTRPLNIFVENGSSSIRAYEIKNIKPDTNYSFKFDIEAKSKTTETDNYYITIIEENKYYDKIATHLIRFNNYVGIKETSIITSKDTEKITINFGSINKEFQKGVTINKVTINNELYPLKYLYLPSSLVENIKSISLRDKSVWERETYYKDALKIIKMHPFVGQGANSWLDYFENVQSYRYETSEVHSYPLQIFMDYGIVAIIAFIAIIAIILIKNRNFYTFVFLLIISHSMLDFDMSFFYIMTLAFILLAIISSKYETDKTNVKLIYKIINIILILILGVSIALEVINLNKETDIDTNHVMELMQNNEYNEVINYVKNKQKYEKYLFTILYTLPINYTNVTYENLQYMYDNIMKQNPGFNFEKNRIRNETIYRIILTTTNEEMKNKFIDIIIKENDRSIEFIKNKEKNRLHDDAIAMYLDMQESLYNAIQKLKK